MAKAASKQSVEAYGVVDDGQLLFESIERTPMSAIRAVDWGDEDLNSVYARMMSGEIKVHCIRIEIMGSLDKVTPDVT